MKTNTILKGCIFLLYLFVSMHSVAQSFAKELHSYEKRILPLIITDTNQIEWDWDCSIPSNIQKKLLSLSCIPEPWHYSPDYSYYCCFNLNVASITPDIILAIFYTNANTDFTRSLIIATFDTLGNEIQSYILATDDLNLVQPLQSNGQDYRIIRTTVALDNKNVNVSEISFYIPLSGDAWRREETVHNYFIDNNGFLWSQ